jgi:hypothetical protein
MWKVNKRLQDLDPKGSPHLEEKLIGGDCRSRSPLSNPQEWARIMGGIKRGSKFFQEQQWR